MAVEHGASLPYHEPAMLTILIQTSFLLLLNIINAVLDKLVYCGLLGEVLLGIAWGTPGFKLLGLEVEEVIVQLGYLGLLLLVYEGGLSTSFTSLKANFLLSSAVAITGISVPMALSFSLQGLIGATPLQAFAAGAALCSTSLGTTFTVLGSSGLSSSRLGVVLTSAAMMDDVVGLVMVQVISNLGGGDIGAITVVRPILVSLAFAVVVPLACRFLVAPGNKALNKYRESHSTSKLNHMLGQRHTAFIVHTLVLIGMVTGATYAGTSGLFAAYIAGAVISWWDSELPHPSPAGQSNKLENANEKAKSRPTTTAQCSTSQGVIADQSNTTNEASTPTQAQEQQNSSSRPQPKPKEPTTAPRNDTTGTAIYERYYHQPVSKILQPFFFASIGFSIPITRMFSGPIVWRGIVYTILMTFGKLVCGLWLVRFSLTPLKDSIHSTLSKIKLPSSPHFWGKKETTDANTPVAAPESTTTPSQPNQTQPTTSSSTANATTSNNNNKTSPANPISIHPPLILAFAMTARGEIGFLISALAESNGVFAPSTPSSASPGKSAEESDIFLIVTWAIVLCTILGPLGVGLSVSRVKKLEARRERECEGSGRDVLGVWGVQ
ncbi:Sodium/hydrogen exchanger [Aaosphaeria arxii CBS 175.79]|uniref:Sodium/hydrogen exchanger n=1 Tax=Aaosphaeria arxii CBS 175.79 TaxID=1450172 RepID=A0A6A5XHC6_9PLEO|nr:Sodium/hydrogen exchanger [Aaosphaeria arxii CBS 175.79]KAF2012618.1 Sodium/hydrogen exchanger [Aaosphaeria arxii CBS 175.79]